MEGHLAQFPSPQSQRSLLLPAPRSLLAPSLLPPASTRGPSLGSDCPSIHFSGQPSPSQGGHSNTQYPQAVSSLPSVLGFFTPDLRGEGGAASFRGKGRLPPGAGAGGPPNRGIGMGGGRPGRQHSDGGNTGIRNSTC